MCQTFECSLGRLRQGDKVEIKLTSRLWKNTLLKVGNISIVKDNPFFLSHCTVIFPLGTVAAEVCSLQREEGREGGRERGRGRTGGRGGREEQLKHQHSVSVN